MLAHNAAFNLKPKRIWLPKKPHLMQKKDITSHLKKVFWPNLCVGPWFQILDILEYASGLKPRSALILNQNPFFEMAGIETS